MDFISCGFFLQKAGGWLFFSFRLELFVVRLQHVNCFSKELLCHLDILDIFLIQRVFLEPICSLLCLTFMILLETRFRLCNHHKETSLRIVDLVIQGVNRFLEVCDGTFCVFLSLVVLLSFRLAPFLLLQISFCLLINDIDHLLDLCQNSVKWIFSLQHDNDLGEFQRFLFPRSSLQKLDNIYTKRRLMRVLLNLQETGPHATRFGSLHLA